MKSFRDRVYEAAKEIPKGYVATYGQLAKIAGKTNAARAVGLFMKQNPDMKTIPCHRVVASNGELTGYSYGKGVITKKKKLISEGVAFLGSRVDLSISKWNPNG